MVGRVSALDVSNSPEVKISLPERRLAAQQSVSPDWRASGQPNHRAERWHARITDESSFVHETITCYRGFAKPGWIPNARGKVMRLRPSAASRRRECVI